MIWIVLIIQLLTLLGGFLFILSLGYGILFGAPYIGTSSRVARAMVEFSNADSDDVVLDLGSGLGSLLFAAHRFAGVRESIGYEVNPLLALLSRIRMRIAGFSDSFRVFTRSIQSMDSHSDVTIVYLYLLPGLMDRIIPTLCQNLSKHVQIVSHGFEFTGIDPLRELRIHNTTLRLYSMNDVMAHEYERGNHS